MIENSDRFFIPSPALADAMKAYSRKFTEVVPTDQVPRERMDEIVLLINKSIKNSKKLTSEYIVSALKLTE